MTCLLTIFLDGLGLDFKNVTIQAEGKPDMSCFFEVPGATPLELGAGMNSRRTFMEDGIRRSGTTDIYAKVSWSLFRPYSF